MVIDKFWKEPLKRLTLRSYFLVYPKPSLNQTPKKREFGVLYVFFFVFLFLLKKFGGIAFSTVAI